VPCLSAISIIDFEFKTEQQEVKEHARLLFEPGFPHLDRLMSVFDNTEIRYRNFCKPLSYYSSPHSFKEQNDEYIRITVDYAVKAIEECMASAKIDADSVTDILFVSTTGLATPSIDAHIINKLRLNENICRTPVFGLGCAGGVAGFSRANVVAKANPDAVVLLVCAELCSLTFMKNDYSKSNFVGSSLFADGVAACIITGNNRSASVGKSISVVSSKSKFYYDTPGVMGWDFQDTGFKVLFSQSIPTIIAEHVLPDVSAFLAAHNLAISDISNFILHPGGKKILSAYEESLLISRSDLKNTRYVMSDYGNMSSPTVLYVLERFYRQGFKDGYGLMLSLGPGFSCEMALLEMKNN